METNARVEAGSNSPWSKSLASKIGTGSCEGIRLEPGEAERGNGGELVEMWKTRPATARIRGRSVSSWLFLGQGVPHDLFVVAHDDVPVGVSGMGPVDRTHIAGPAHGCRWLDDWRAADLVIAVR